MVCDDGAAAVAAHDARVDLQRTVWGGADVDVELLLERVLHVDVWRDGKAPAH